jgi:hypothetical protein
LKEGIFQQKVPDKQLHLVRILIVYINSEMIEAKFS